MRATLFLTTLMLAFAGSIGACNLIEREVACDRDRDCPRDAGMPFCERWENVDSGPNAGFCTDDDQFAGDFYFEPTDSGVVPPLNGEAN